ncbi:helix-turn-helix domain-containing protein [Micromonospora sp. NPDC003197]
MRKVDEPEASSVPRRILGRELRELRTEARMSLDGVARTLQYSPRKMWWIETGAGEVRAHDVRIMCALYETSPELTDALVALAGKTTATGWWHSYSSTIPAWFDLYARLESAARRLRTHQSTLIPDLLQTRKYAHGLCQQHPDLTADEQEQLIKVRLKRQTLLHRRHPSAPRYDVMLCESALLRVVGSPACMAQQLRHLLEASRLPNISIRVLPLTASQHSGAIAGTFVMLDFPTGNRTEPEPPVVYREMLTGALYLDRKEELAAYERTWASLDTLALNEEQSRQLIKKIAERFQHG